MRWSATGFAPPRLRGSVGWLADHRVKEDGRDGTPRFAKWTPNPFAASPRVEQKPASEAPAGRWASYAPEGIFSCARADLDAALAVHARLQYVGLRCPWPRTPNRS
jgi:hypothetical protein